MLGVGFEPTRPKPADLKSAPLDLSGIQAVSLSHQCQEAIPDRLLKLNLSSIDNVPTVGLEPTTIRLKAVRSTN